MPKFTYQDTSSDRGSSSTFVLEAHGLTDGPDRNALREQQRAPIRGSPFELRGVGITRTYLAPKTLVSGGPKIPQSAAAKKEFAGALCVGILADA
jgi:hypothetical protein